MASSNVLDIRKSTKRAKEIQSRQDYVDEIKHLESLCEIEAIADIVSFKKVSLLDNIKKLRCTASPSTVARLTTSSIQRKFSQVPARILEKKRDEIVSFAVTEVNKDSKLVKALDFVRKSRDVVDPGRLLYEAGLLFDQIGMSDRALLTLMKAIKGASPEEVVDTYDLPITPEYLRKIRVMSKFQEEALKQKREELRLRYLAVERERQRLRTILTHGHAMRLHLVFENYNEAHSCMQGLFGLCIGDEELHELLWYTHFLLADFAEMTKTQLSSEEKVLRDTGGPLAEGHIYILLQLLEIDPKNTDLMLWLGHRYGQCFNFALSTKYYTQARLNKLHESGMLDILNLDGPDPEGAAIVVASRRRIAARAKEEKETATNVSKVRMLNFNTDVEVDEDSRVNRPDFCSFGGIHRGTATILYTTPNLGWQADSVAQEQKYLQDMALITNKPKLPKIQSRRIK